jgi:hypothetical protein
MELSTYIKSDTLGILVCAFYRNVEVGRISYLQTNIINHND